jgi:dihydropteroate synthase
MIYTVNGKTINFEQPQIMAIVNLTPDSFYDGGKYDNLNDILADVKEKIKAGANIIDIGAASSRPGAVALEIEEEWKRLEAPLQTIRNEFPNVIISIDTYRSEIAKRSVANGAEIINDISGGNLDANMFKTMAELQVPYILMHMKGDPSTMQNEPFYNNVVEEVKLEFKTKIKELEDLNFHKLILDVGFGFGKNLQHNYQLLKHMNGFNELGYPILAGISRKSMINKVIHTNPVTALNGTTVLHTIALLNGAKILRVHDVLEAKQAIELVGFYKNA